MFKFIRQRLQNKLILAFVVVLLIPTGVIGAYTNSIITQTTIDKAHADKLRTAELTAANLEQGLLDIQNKLLFLSRSPLTKRYIEALAGSTISQSSIDSETSFLKLFLTNSNGYQQISILDPNGKQILDITRTADGVNASAQSDFEDHSQSDYFTQATDLASGQVYISSLNLNQTNGKIDIPHVPIINTSTPLYATNGTTVGVLVLKASAGPLFAAVKSSDRDEVTYLLDSDGSYLMNPDQSKLYGRILNGSTTLYKDEPNDSGPILAQSQAEGILFGSPDLPNTMQTFIRINPPGQENIQWTLIYLDPINDILQNVYAAQRVIIFVALSALLIAVIVALFVTSGVVRPVRQLANVAGSMSQGHWDVPLPNLKSGDEISQLASAFETMSIDLKSVYDNLEARVHQRTAELEVANALALESSRLKSEFMATMSHELRTPLNAMIGFSGILLEGMGGEIDEDARHMIERIRLNSKRLLKLINDILDIAKIEAGRMEIVSVPITPRKLAETWRSQISILAEEKALDFLINIDPALPDQLYGDPERLSQIVINLLSNAVKFTEKGSIKLSMKPAEKNWIIEVTDSGIGIPPHALNYIFEEFRQVDGSTTRSYGGTGLGLAIVRNLVRMMEGTITVNSALGQGSTFTVTLLLKPVIELDAAKTVAA